MDWQFTEDRPIWQQLTDQLALRILKGEYPPGERLPGVRELAAQAGVNRLGGAIEETLRPFGPVAVTVPPLISTVPQLGSPDV